MLGGGLVPGAVVLLAGEPGVGKSTLLLDVAQQWAARAAGPRWWSAARSRRARCGCGPSATGACTSGSTWPPRPTSARCSATSTRSSRACSCSTRCRPLHGRRRRRPGGVTQVRAVTAALVAVAKERGIATVLVGHVTKDGRSPVPRVLEHLVDVVLQFEGDKHSSLRMVRGLKNRFGAGRRGRLLRDARGRHPSLPDPSGLFLTRYAEPVPGTCVTVAMEGRRALVTEVQALIGATVPGSPRRTVSGLDSARLAMVLAVLQRRCNGRLHDREVFAATVGGIRVVEPAADLAWRSRSPRPPTTAVAPDLVAIGEVGLTGEVRRVGAVPRRLAEAARLGFRYALGAAGCGPAATGAMPAGMRVLEVGDLRPPCATRSRPASPPTTRPAQGGRAALAGRGLNRLAMYTSGA